MQHVPRAYNKYFVLIVRRATFGPTLKYPLKGQPFIAHHVPELSNSYVVHIVEESICGATQITSKVYSTNVFTVLDHFSILIVVTVLNLICILRRQRSKVNDSLVDRVVKCISTFDVLIVKKLKCGKPVIMFREVLFRVGHVSKIMPTCVVRTAKRLISGIIR